MPLCLIPEIFAKNRYIKKIKHDLFNFKYINEHFEEIMEESMIESNDTARKKFFKILYIQNCNLY